MTDQSNLFNQSNSPAVDPQQNPATDPLQDLLASIKNEQGVPKYKDVPTALSALQHSQAFIDQLKREKAEQDAKLAQLQAELEKRQAVEDVVNRLSQPSSNAATTNTEVLTPEQIAKLVQDQLQQATDLSQKEANLRKVNETLITRFGDKAGEVLKAKATELGMTVAELGELAQKTPQAVLAYFPATTKDTPQPSGLNTSGFQSSVNTTEIPNPSKSILSGASSKEQAAYMAQIKQAIYAKYGVTQS